MIPKSVSAKRIKSNSEVFDFKLSDEEMLEVRLESSYCHHLREIARLLTA